MRRSGQILRRVFGFALLAGALASCQGNEGPRALILVTASDAAGPSDTEISSKLDAFSAQHGRKVRRLPVDTSREAVELSARGEADVALIAESTDIQAFVAADHGRDVGVCALSGGRRLRVLSVNAKQHPKADALGEALASFLARAP